MSAAITCFAAFQGLTTSLDTLCSQAYGSGKKHLVGLYCQRMMLLLLIFSVPIAMSWIFSENILCLIIPNAESVRLCSIYLNVLVFAIPGYAAFEVGKRFLQAQGLFRATTLILLIGAPINAFLMWFLVFRLNLGFIGAPISIAVTRTLLPLLLILYVKFFNGSECWGGLSKRSFSNMGVIVRLALPGMIMVVAEWLCFEIMTVMSARFGIEYLATQSILVTLITISFQLPFPLSIAASTRVAYLIGAGQAGNAKVAARVAVIISCLCSFSNFLVYIVFRDQLPRIFTDDDALATLITAIIPLVGVTTFFDGVGVAAHGLLRGIGKQSIGGLTNLFAYYVISLPLSLGLGFGLNWKLQGLWLGLTIGLINVSLIEFTYLLLTDWELAVMEALARCAAD
jgi:MATE family multidrug resistance protein